MKEIQTTDEHVKKVVLKVSKQCLESPGIGAEYINNNIKSKFIDNFWNKKIADDKKCKFLVIECLLSMAKKLGSADIIKLIVEFLKDESDSMRKMSVECIDKIISKNVLNPVTIF